MDERQRQEMESRIAQLESRLSRGDRRESMETAFWALMHNLFPDEARKHLKAAGREQLLAARAYLDHWIKKMDEGQQAVGPGGNGARHESIEVD